VSDTRRKDGEEGGGPLPYPLPGGASGIGWERTRPATFEEIVGALDRIEQQDGRAAPDVEELEELVRDAFTIMDNETTRESFELVQHLYPLYRDAASVERRLAVIDEAWSRGFDDGRWPASVDLLTTLEREPALIAACAARYAAFVMMYTEVAFGEIARILACAEYESDNCYAATFLGLLALGDAELLSELRDHRLELTDDQVATICGVTLVEPSFATVLFLLEWMEEVQRRGDQVRFAQLASFVERAGATSWSEELPPTRYLRASDLRFNVCYHQVYPVDREQFGRHLRPRLEALAGRETGSRLIPPVLAAWGLQREGEAA
jgi:hypothetical protein